MSNNSSELWANDNTSNYRSDQHPQPRLFIGLSGRLLTSDTCHVDEETSRSNDIRSFIHHRGHFICQRPKIIFLPLDSALIPSTESCFSLAILSVCRANRALIKARQNVCACALAVNQRNSACGYARESFEYWWLEWGCQWRERACQKVKFNYIKISLNRKHIRLYSARSISI